jgi:hypothetical protein
LRFVYQPIRAKGPATIRCNTLIFHPRFGEFELTFPWRSSGSGEVETDSSLRFWHGVANAIAMSVPFWAVVLGLVWALT